MRLLVPLAIAVQLCGVDAFVPSLVAGRNSIRPTATSAALASSAATVTPEDSGISVTPAEKRKQERKALVRKEGGLFAFDTKYGALNPFAIYYGIVAIILGIPWYIALTFCQLLYKITGNRFDRQRRIPIFITHIWGTLLMRLTRCYPKIENLKTLRDFYKEYVPL